MSKAMLRSSVSLDEALTFATSEITRASCVSEFLEVSRFVDSGVCTLAVKPHLNEWPGSSIQ